MLKYPYRKGGISMIIKFGVEGFLSIHDKVELYFIPVANTRLNNTRFASNFLFTPKYKIMKSAVLFGANASGKSNLLFAVKHFQDIILHGVDLTNVDAVRQGYANYDADKDIGFSISMFNPKTQVEYEYNLKYNLKGIVAESFVRDDTTLFTYSDHILTIADAAHVKEKTAAQKLFSGEATETCLKKLTDYMSGDVLAFQDLVKNIIVNIQDIVATLVRNNIFTCLEDTKKLFMDNRKDVLGILQTLDNSISGFAFAQLPGHNFEMLLQRRNKYYHLGVESKGIQKIINLMNRFIEALHGGKTLIIDELDSSISTNTLIELFNNFINTDLNQGQFIVTSHNPFLLNQNMFHPQQMYIVNKNKRLNTEVYSVAEFNIRNDKNKLYEDYLKGKFGGVNG
jgi:AAA15 family ATPase/GTPase